eukprot:m.217858 g.217858  ORF g.217858 m.217858 type:complete len:804 (-) comp17207_c0_seq3:1657-4068(-)
MSVHEVGATAGNKDCKGCSSPCPECSHPLCDEACPQCDVFGYSIGKCDECGVTGCTNCKPDLELAMCDICELQACPGCQHTGAQLPQRALTDEDPNPIHTCSKCQRQLCASCVYSILDEDDVEEMVSCSRCHALICQVCKPTFMTEDGILPACYHCGRLFCEKCISTSTVVCYKQNCTCAQRCVCDVACLDCRSELCTQCGVGLNRTDTINFRLRRKTLAKERSQARLQAPRIGYELTQPLDLKVPGLQDMQARLYDRAEHMRRQQAARDDGQLSGSAFMRAEARADEAAADLLREEEEAERRAAKNKKKNKKKKAKKAKKEEGDVEVPIDKNAINGHHLSNGSTSQVNHNGQPQPSPSTATASQPPVSQPRATAAQPTSPTSSKIKNKNQSASSASTSKPTVAPSKSTSKASPSRLDQDDELKAQAQAQLDGAMEIEDIRALELAIAAASMVKIKCHTAQKLLKRLKKAQALEASLDSAIVSNDQDLIFAAAETVSTASKRIVALLIESLGKARAALSRVAPDRLAAFDALFADEPQANEAGPTDSNPLASASVTTDTLPTVLTASEPSSTNVRAFDDLPTFTFVGDSGPLHTNGTAAAVAPSAQATQPTQAKQQESASVSPSRSAKADPKPVRQYPLRFAHPTAQTVIDIRETFPVSVQVSDAIRLGWSVGGASPPQVELLTFLQGLKLLQYKDVLLSRGLTLARLLTFTTQELMALGILSEVALNRLATVQALHKQGLPMTHKRTPASGRCHLCFERNADQICQSCQHSVTCQQCTGSITCLTCPSCRGGVQGFTAIASQ